MLEIIIKDMVDFYKESIEVAFLACIDKMHAGQDVPKWLNPNNLPSSELMKVMGTYNKELESFRELTYNYWYVLADGEHRLEQADVIPEIRLVVELCRLRFGICKREAEKRVLDTFNSLLHPEHGLRLDSDYLNMGV
jgi:hypothetical protein